MLLSFRFIFTVQGIYMLETLSKRAHAYCWYHAATVIDVQYEGRAKFRPRYKLLAMLLYKIEESVGELCWGGSGVGGGK